jgi:hypothetical protein
MSKRPTFRFRPTLDILEDRCLLNAAGAGDQPVDKPTDTTDKTHHSTHHHKHHHHHHHHTSTGTTINVTASGGSTVTINL